MFKRILAMITAFFCMIAGFSPIFAEETGSAANDCSITISGVKPGQTYTAYQIFSGQADPQKTHFDLSDLNWGSSIDPSALHGQTEDNFGDVEFNNGPEGAANVASAIITKGSSDQELQKMAETLAQLVDKSKPAGQAAPANGRCVISNLNPGYYLVINTLDSTGSTSGEPASISPYLLVEVVHGNIEVNPKKGAPTLTKQVKANGASFYHDKGSAEPIATTWTSAADYSNGDQIDYQLVVTLPKDVRDYENKYQLTINDTIDKGLTLGQTPGQTPDVKVAIEIGDSAPETVNKQLYTIKWPAPSKPGTLSISFSDFRTVGTNGQAVSELASDAACMSQDTVKLIITYSCTLNDQAVMSRNSNDNKATLTYSNSPDSTSTETTPEHNAKVYTAELDVFKVDKNGDPLQGAEFTLYKQDSDGAYQLFEGPLKAETSTPNEFCFKGLGSGEYKIEETTAPEGYIASQPMTFTLTGDHCFDSAGDLSFNGFTVGNCEHVVPNSDGTLSVKITNLKTSSLPSTGSMGLAVLAVLGAAAVVLGLMMSRKSKTAR